MGNGSITNAASIRWLWHSGLGRGREGDVLFSEGVSVLNGDLLAANAPVPLARGRTYYWSGLNPGAIVQLNLGWGGYFGTAGETVGFMLAAPSALQP